ncbi:MAG TPA: hypothetical protein VFO93_17805 [Hymenobacter sp.]|uniref:hypothetical protein n=1 Tax=Hymenobacter sp. TaxID=1898978 RepID=UPI002D803028|nr:hypothetical protein [Hymenobacter sp.]HET9505404.1 hypothetical protein [Hymenobacter sp.]
MKKSLLGLAALAMLAACRESNTSMKSAPSAEPIASTKTLCYDTTYATPAQQPRAYSYTTDIVVGTGKTVTVPVQIDWTTVTENGCPQVASVRVYQLGVADLRTNVVVKTLRDAACKPGPLPNSDQRATTGAVYVSLTCQAKAVRAFSSFRFTLNGLGYHDSLEPTLTPATSAAR